MVDLTPDNKGRTRARLLDLVPGRSGAACAAWLAARNQAFRDGIGVATLDLFHGDKNPSTTSSRAPSPYSLPLTSGNWAIKHWTRFAAASSSRPPATAGARVTRSAASAPSCAAGSRSSPTASKPDWTARSPPMSDMTRSS